MIRHGQASFGSGNYDRLSPTGERQARILAEHLAGQKRPFDAVYCGNMERHKKTAEPLLSHYAKAGHVIREAVLWSEFDEFNMAAVWQSQVERMAKEDPAVAEDLARIAEDPRAFNRIFKKTLLRWVSGDVEPSVAPRWRDFTGRVCQGMRRLMEVHGPGKRLIVFTSAGPVCAAVQMALSISDVKAMELGLQTQNASVTRFKYNDSEIGLCGFNEVFHLEREGDGSLLTYR
jgi:broad specificity phosphatase PhoE